MGARCNSLLVLVLLAVCLAVAPGTASGSRRRIQGEETRAELARSARELALRLETAEPWYPRAYGRNPGAKAIGLHTGKELSEYQASLGRLERILWSLPRHELTPELELERQAALGCAISRGVVSELRPWARDPRFWLERIEAALLDLPLEPLSPAETARWLARAEGALELCNTAPGVLKGVLPQLASAAATRAKNDAERLLQSAASGVFAGVQDEAQKAGLRAAVGAAHKALLELANWLATECAPPTGTERLGPLRFLRLLRAETGTGDDLALARERISRALVGPLGLAVEATLTRPASPDLERLNRLAAALPSALAPLGFGGWPAPGAIRAQFAPAAYLEPAVELECRVRGLEGTLRVFETEWSPEHRADREAELGPAGMAAALLIEAFPGGLAIERLAANQPEQSSNRWPDPIGARALGWLFVEWMREIGLFEDDGPLGPAVDAALKRRFQIALLSLRAGMGLHAFEKSRSELIEELELFGDLDPEQGQELVNRVELDPTLGMEALLALDWIERWRALSADSEAPAVERQALLEFIQAHPRARPGWIPPGRLGSGAPKPGAGSSRIESATGSDR